MIIINLPLSHNGNSPVSLYADKVDPSYYCLRKHCALSVSDQMNTTVDFLTSGIYSRPFLTLHNKKYVTAPQAETFHSYITTSD